MTHAQSPEERRAALRVGTTLGERWTLERLLGVGGMAAVYAARAPDGAVAALKLLHPEHAIRGEIRDRFLREGLAANSVDHPGAVRVLDSATLEDEETAYLVMELLEGESLGARHSRARLSAEELLDVLDQTLDVLATAHDRGIVHRDLKPDNLFIMRDGTVKVLDFGLARFLDAVPGELKTRTGIAMGTLPYMSPEQALGKRDEIDGRTDLFALGAMSFRLLSGRRVHEADSEAELLLAMATRAAPPLASVVPSAPAPLALIVDMALGFSREARYPDARTMQGDVRAARAGTTPPYASRVSSAREEATNAERRVPAPAAVAMTAGAAVAASAAVAAVGPSTPVDARSSPGPAPAWSPVSAPVPRPIGPARPAVVVPAGRAPVAPVPARSVLARREVVIALALLAALLLVVLLLGLAFTAGRWLSAPSPVAEDPSAATSGEPTEATPPGIAKKQDDKKHKDKKPKH